MKIVVCIKRVPDTAARLKIATSQKDIASEGIDYIVSAYDEFAVEEALKTQEAFGGEVTVVTLCEGDASKELRTCLAMGAHKAVQLKGKGYQDAYSVAKALADYLKPLAPDIVFFGKQALDDDFHAIGTMVATFLDLPLANVVSKLEIKDKHVVAERDIEGAKERLEFDLPCVITTQKGLNTPRFAGLKGIMNAKKKPLETLTLPDTTPLMEIQKLQEPPPRPPGKIVGEGVGAVAELVRLLHEEAKAL
jgi:electron transfer flavoprotein beta subunit